MPSNRTTNRIHVTLTDEELDELDEGLPENMSRSEFIRDAAMMRVRELPLKLPDALELVGRAARGEVLTRWERKGS